MLQYQEPGGPRGGVLTVLRGTPLQRDKPPGAFTSGAVFLTFLALLLALIHRITEKVNSRNFQRKNSRKSVSKILHISGPIGPEEYAHVLIGARKG